MKEYFDLKISDLQNAVEWSIGYVERSLSIYEKYESHDSRAKEAILGAIEFSENGKRTNNLRKLAMSAYRASKETEMIQASFAANAASLIAALAYTHPFRDPKQARHILGPIVYSAMSIEIDNNDETFGNDIIEKSIKNANANLVSLINEYPRQEKRGKRVDELFYYLDQEIANSNR